ncbi:MAG: glycine cleavage system aminomethyltransferase GcvT [Candidatus Dadabacteria bacterium]|jgi:aminomethyltransferase
MKKTALNSIHKELGAKMVEFAEWEMPVQYEGVRQEHLAVRKSAGLFDVSHMGEIEVKGIDAIKFCQWVTTNDAKKVQNFQAQYTLLCNNEGGVVDDVIIYKFSDEHFLFCVNASNSDKDYAWIKKEENNFDVVVSDKSSQYSQIAIQGPDSKTILSEALGENLDSIKKFRFEMINWNGYDMIVARTGYTGEEGFEIFLPWDGAPALWKSLMEMGREFQINPCGLAARDTLRIEMGYPLYGHEIDEDINPLEAGLERYIKLDGDDFIGKAALLKSLDAGLKNKLVGFELLERGIPREGYSIFKNGTFLGNVTSGTLSPSLEKSIGLGYLSIKANDDRIQIQIRDTFRDAKIVNTPFYSK